MAKNPQLEAVAGLRGRRIRDKKGTQRVDMTRWVVSVESVGGKR